MDDPTLSDHLDGFLERARLRLAPSTVRSYASTAQRYLIPHLGDMRLSELTTLELERTYAKLLLGGGHDGKPLSGRSVRYAHAILHAALVEAVRHGLLAVNPASGATVPRHNADGPQVKEPTVWSPEELREFLDLVVNDPLYHLWAVAAMTGLRRGELLGLAWPHVDFDRHVLHVRQTLTRADGVTRISPPKNLRKRTIALDAWTVGVLADRRELQRVETGGRTENEWDLVFTTPEGAPLTPLSITTAFRDLVASLPLPRIRLHDLRHGHATHLLVAGAPVQVVSSRLGHASTKFTLDVYAHSLPVMDVAAVDALARLLGRGEPDDEREADVG